MIEGLGATETKSKRRGSGSALNCFVMFMSNDHKITETAFLIMFPTMILSSNHKLKIIRVLGVLLVIPLFPLVIIGGLWLSFCIFCNIIIET